MLSRFSISTKLIALVSLMLVALASMGAFAIFEMRAINASAQDIQTSWLPSIRLLGELRTQSARYRAVLRDYLTEPDETFMADIQKNLDARAADYAAASKAYAPMIRTPEEAALYKSLDANWTKFLKAADDVIASAHVYNTTAARAANAERAVPAGREMDAVLKKMVDLNDSGAAESGRKAIEDYHSGFLFVTGLLLAMIALGLVAAVLIVRDIAHGIASVIAPMRALASGDLGANVPCPSEGTENGRIAAPLQVFKDALIAKKAADIAASQDATAKMRRAETLAGITGRFEAMIGELVGSLASASTEMESSASTMTDAADTTRMLSVTASATSRSVSDSIQSTAAATEEITASVDEIGRQVMESSKVAQRAVAQAEKTNTSISQL